MIPFDTDGFIGERPSRHTHRVLASLDSIARITIVAARAVGSRVAGGTYTRLASLTPIAKVFIFAICTVRHVRVSAHARRGVAAIICAQIPIIAYSAGKIGVANTRAGAVRGLAARTRQLRRRCHTRSAFAGLDPAAGIGPSTGSAVKQRVAGDANPCLTDLLTVA